MRPLSVLASILVHGSLLGTAAVLLGDGHALAEQRTARVLVAPSLPAVPVRQAPDEPVAIEEPVVVEEAPPLVDEAPRLAEPEPTPRRAELTPPEQPLMVRSAPEVLFAAEPFARVRHVRVVEAEAESEPAPAELAPPAPWVEARPRDDLNRPPDYPADAIRRGQSGEVLLRVHVAADGEVESVEIERPSRYPLLDRAAVQAARAWRFEPALRHGVPVESHTLVPIEFRLKR